jgi:hypothetical protein
MDLWNGRMGRWVKRGSKGIALIDRTNPKRPRLKYVFDIQDTAQSRNSAKAPYIWQMEREHAPHVRKTLGMAYGIDDPDMRAQITEIVKRQMSGYADRDEGFKDFVADSAVYSIMSRCGLETGDFKEEFSNISRYDTDEKVLELGLASVDLSEKILRNIENVVRRYDTWKAQKHRGKMKGAIRMAELEYVKAGDYLIPALTLGEEAETPLGKYGLMRFRHLRDNDKFQYSLLEIRGQLDSHLREIDETANRRVESFMEEALKMNPIPENLKNADPLEWVGRMENLKTQAEEIVTRELIFTPPTHMNYLRDVDLPEMEELDGLPNMPF